MGYLQQAEEFFQFAQSTKIEEHTEHFGLDVVCAVKPKKQLPIRLKKRYRCGKMGLPNATFPRRMKEIEEEDCTLAIGSREAMPKGY